MVFSILSTFIFGQEPVTYYYGDSTISATGHIENGQPHGLWKNFHINGRLKSTGNWFYGKLDSTWTFYFSNGYIKEQIQYFQGIKNGYSYTYDLDENYGHYLSKKQLYIEGDLHGRQISYYPNGSIKNIVTYSEGVKTGFEINLDTLENPKNIIEYRNDKAVSFQRVNQIHDSVKTGKWISLDEKFEIREENHYQNGSIVKEKEKKNNSTFKNVKYTIEGLEQQPKDTLFSGQFVNGEPVGQHIFYDSLNNPVRYVIYDSLSRKIEKGEIKNYKKSGPVKAYYANGNIKYRGYYLKGLKHGKWIYYFKDTLAKEQEGKFNYARLHGKWIWYYKDGDTLRIENHRNNKRNGLYISYDPYGNIVMRGYYYNNLKQEHWIEQWGFVTMKGQYFDNQRNGEWVGTYPDGTLAFKGNYVRGKEQGKFIFYFPNGHKRRIEFYKFGRPDGHWQFFDIQGNLYKVKTFKKGETLYYKP